jgi:hypothetical protein
MTEEQPTAAGKFWSPYIMPIPFQQQQHSWHEICGDPHTLPVQRSCDRFCLLLTCLRIQLPQQLICYQHLVPSTAFPRSFTAEPSLQDRLRLLQQLTR